ncbi:hypothetical protein Drorol1_Dr00014165 [Drosera rotundifolia]
MHRQIRQLTTISRQIINFKSNPESHHPHQTPFHFNSSIPFHSSPQTHQKPNLSQPTTPNHPQSPKITDTQLNSDAYKVQTVLKRFNDGPDEELEEALDGIGIQLSEGLVVDVLKRHRSDWRSAFRFWNWVIKGENSGGYVPGSRVFNEVIDTMGRMRRFEEVRKVFDEMSERDGVVNERSYGIMVHRYAAGHRVEDATDVFYRRKKMGMELDLVAFQTLLMALCRYKHVETAEFLFHSKKGAFVYDIKTWNIILNGWSVLGNLREVKRFWNEIIRSKIKLDRYTYGIFINALAKAGKISKAVELFRAMWEKGCTPDVPICNTVIDGLCFKKRIPEALAIFKEMNDKDCQPDVATYNTLIKHLCKIHRMEKVYELLEEMEQKKGHCLPNDRTYGFLLKSSKNPEDVSGLLERMERNECKMTDDLYNLMLRWYMKWGCEEEVQSVWSRMERDGIGPDQRSYTVMVHGLHAQGRLEEALKYYGEMVSKGFAPEPRTKLLVHAMKIKSNERVVTERRNTWHKPRMKLK